VTFEAVVPRGASVYGTLAAFAGSGDAIVLRHMRRDVGRTVGLTIVSIMSLAGMDEVDFLKIDIEGAEGEVFADPNAWIQRVGVMAIEIDDDKKPNCRATIYRSAARQFDFEWQNGENVFFARSGFIDQVALATCWRPIGQRV
jgi:hypothetical protein